MSRSVLIVTNIEGFGVLMQQTLEDTGRYSAKSVMYTGLEQRAVSHDLVIFDMDDNSDAEQLGMCENQAAELHLAWPKTIFVLVPPSGDFQHPVVTRLKPDGLLTKPVTNSDLVSIVDGLLSQTSAQALAPAKESPPVRIQRTNQPDAPSWLEDVDRAAQYLARLSLESSAQAALILRGSSLWAYAGEMNQSEVEELTQVVATFQLSQTRPLGSQPGSGRADLARYTRLPSSGKEVMVYITSLAEGMKLVLVYDAATPFSMIRMQANYLSRALATRPDSLESNAPPAHTTAAHRVTPALDVGMEPPNEKAAPVEDTEPVFQAQTNAKIGDILPHDALPLLDDVPIQMPGTGRGNQESMNINPTGLSNSFETNHKPPDLQPSLSEIESGLPDLPEKPGIFQQADNLSQTSASPDQSFVKLHYTCLLVPRMIQHYLTGDLAFVLGEYLPQICLAYGWRLEKLVVEPEYLGWVVQAPSYTAPLKIIRAVRQRTSERLFKDFANLEQENPSGDFWTPSYYLTGGASFPERLSVQEFINKIRSWQINPNLPPPTIQR